MNLKKLRKKLGLTQSELGARLGISKSAVSRIENGKRGMSKTIELLIVATFPELFQQ
jgi:transcriptional regulator with XRE-family HTH domain